MGKFEAGGEGYEPGGAKPDAGACSFPESGSESDEGGEASAEEPRWQARSADATRERLAKEFGLTAAYVGVGKLAAVLGIAPSTIYGHMRAGRFFLPYRMLNASPMVRVDDLAEWLGSSEGVVPAGSPRLGRRTAETHDAEEVGACATPEDPNAKVDRIVAAALRSMGMESELARKAKAKPTRKLGSRVKPL